MEPAGMETDVLDLPATTESDVPLSVDERVDAKPVKVDAVAQEGSEGAEQSGEVKESDSAAAVEDEPMEQEIEGNTADVAEDTEVESGLGALVNNGGAIVDGEAEAIPADQSTEAAVAPIESTETPSGEQSETTEAAQTDSGIAEASLESSTQVEGHENLLQAAINAAENSTDLLEPTATVLPTTEFNEEFHKTDSSVKPKPQPGSFSLGVPGLTFSAQNLKVASDGTKMVQIHQSQITPSQLKALQANPNIKVVFRHIPSGKSFTTPPKNLFQSKATKRKVSEDGTMDDSIYNFDDDFEDDMIMAPQPRTKFSRMTNGNAKYARYNPNVGLKKRGPGRPRSIPEGMGMMGLHGGKKPALPAQIMLTDALAKLNNPNATQTIKVHMSQVTHDILINMELNPAYNIVLTSKHEATESEDPLQDLVKEWEEKEQEEKEEETPTTIDPSSATTGIEEASESMEVKEEAPIEEEPFVLDEEEIARIQMEEEKEADERLAAEQQRLRDIRKEKEEADLLAAALTEKPSRSGRIRKPSRFSLDIARLTKRTKSGYTSGDDDPPITPPPASKMSPPQVKSPTQTPQPIQDPGKSVKRSRGRPKKEKPLEIVNLEENKEETKNEVEAAISTPEKSASSPQRMDGVPRVMMSPADKRMADSVLEDKEEDQAKSDAQDLVEGAKDKLEEKGEKTEKGEEQSKIDEVKKTEEVEKECTKDEESKPEGEAMEVGEQSKDQVKVLDDDKKEEEGSSEKTDSKDETGDAEVKTDEASEVLDKDANIETTSVETENKEGEKPEQKEGENPSDILARKLDIMSPDGEAKDEKNEETKPEDELKDFIEEEGDVDNKYRLRKLLQQCSIDEIRTVAIPCAMQSFSFGDFFLYKSGQMSKQQCNYSALYQQLEQLHSAVEKESIRYSTLLRRANKVGGDRRMDKVILMPVYNKQAAESLNINSSSIDAHICGIHQRTTSQMIAANSFRMACKMEPPLHRLTLPDLTDKAFQARKKNRLNPPKVPYQKATYHESSANYVRKDSRYTPGWKRGSSGYQVRKPNYLQPGSQTTLQEQARLQLASRHQSQLNATQSTTEGTENNTSVTMAQSNEAGSAATSELATAMDTNTTTTDQEGTTMVMDDGSGGLVSAEEGKQLVSIGDGQYVELPEGYTLIQTDDGYIIGQPGATFVQGEDGNVYMTSTEENTEATDQVLTTTAQMSDQPAEASVVPPLSET
uniref:microtubule-associated protein futsch isoform X2 n=1 Tax=Ciona intestinalis TaxID=7719 RepID=UPI00089DC828|nr:microtubule-associated protein futsch isoform X2 [Ciona intestinalis]|eukprot:XP_018669293.1 microtubule-associated protein futsch isoform X2 [Ciona intestinalis]